MKKRLSALFLALVLGLSISVPAFAAEIAESRPITVSGNGRDYDIWATLYEDRGRYSGAAWVESSNGSNFPVDQIKAWAYVEDGAGNMVESKVGTLSSPYYFLVVQTKYSFFPGTEMESYGLIEVKQSDGGYDTEETLHATASVSSRSVISNQKPHSLSVNSCGETYGPLSTAIATKKHLDLIAAVGTEGQKGYIRYDDMMADDEKIFDSRYGGKKIPLYDLDGQRIGSFFIEFSHLDFTGKDIETVKAELADSTAQNPKLWALADEFLVDGKYPVNAKGQTYGPRILREAVGYSPDLIPAVSAEENDGVAGYIRCRKELPISEEEMAALCAATSEPLYDVNGNVIGTFEWKSDPVQFLGKAVPEVQTELAGGPQGQ